ncbi:MAG TPA: hypothetical protein VKB75_17355 [Jatrophihabitans sp.]|nr:hypothetical protein [Jatrophihabitans sp.]
MRRLLSPGWVLFHLLSWGAATGMVFLGRWQLHVAEVGGFPLQNTSYVVQWWLFAACALLFWARVIRDAVRKSPPATVATGGELVRRSGSVAPTRPGPAMLQARSANGEPVAYRGYHIPDSSESVVRSHGDPMHDAYNDYLWQLALADGATPDGKLRGSEGDDRQDDPSALGDPPNELTDRAD